MSGERRLASELQEIQKSPPPGCSAGPIEENIYKWQATITGPNDSPYEGGLFYLFLEFTTAYPFEPPKVTFKTKIFHPNISMEGRVCVDILKRGNWSAAMSVCGILISLTSLLTDPNPNDPLVPSAARLYLTNRRGYDEKAKEWTKKFASTS